MEVEVEEDEEDEEAKEVREREGDELIYHQNLSSRLIRYCARAYLVPLLVSFGNSMIFLRVLATNEETGGGRVLVLIIHLTAPDPAKDFTMSRTSKLRRDPSHRHRVS